ncbi:DUF4942 domain-containing protein [Cronobacter turicensis]
MSDLSIIHQGSADCTVYEGMGYINNVISLLDEYALRKNEVQELHSRVMSGRFGDAFAYFANGAGQNSIHDKLRVERFFRLDRALCALDEDFWNRLIEVINVKNFMPAHKRDLWTEDLSRWRKADNLSLNAVKPLPFERESVLMTAKTLINEKKFFLSEMVEGVFRKLSPDHFTNKSEGFTQLMIVANVIPSLGSHSDNQEYLNDLRKVIGLLQNRQGSESISSHYLLEELKEHYGEWKAVDGDSLYLKAHKNRTVHIRIQQEVADTLNSILALRHPNIIPFKKERGKKRATNHFLKDKSYPLVSEMLPFPVSDYFGELSRKSSTRTISQDGKNSYAYSLPGTYLHSDVTNKAVERIFFMIGGQPDSKRSGWFTFGFNPAVIFDYLFINGALPDQNTHQFYPTQGDIRDAVVGLAEISEGHALLEPSAGFGDLLEHVNKGAHVTAVEVHPVAAATLRAKGYDSIQRDFLTIKQTELSHFDRVIMNPPFSGNRWMIHLLHAITFIKPGGKLVAILPASAKHVINNKLIGDHYDISFNHVSGKSFEGTLVNVTMIVIDKHE